MEESKIMKIKKMFLQRKSNANGTENKKTGRAKGLTLKQRREMEKAERKKKIAEPHLLSMYERGQDNYSRLTNDLPPCISGSPPYSSDYPCIPGSHEGSSPYNTSHITIAESEKARTNVRNFNERAFIQKMIADAERDDELERLHAVYPEPTFGKEMNKKYSNKFIRPKPSVRKTAKLPPSRPEPRNPQPKTRGAAPQSRLQGPKPQTRQNGPKPQTRLQGPRPRTRQNGPAPKPSEAKPIPKRPKASRKKHRQV